MRYTLKTKLTLSYIMVAFISIFLVSLSANLLLEKHFREYVSANQEKNNSDLTSTLAQQYRQLGEWNLFAIEPLGINALENGTIIKVIDNNGTTIWDAQTHNNGMCQSIIIEMNKNMSNRYPFMKGEYSKVPYPILVDMKQVGTVEIGVYGPYYLNNNDLAFITSLNQFLIIIAFLSLLFSIILGSIMAKKISLPISNVILSAEAISKGLFNEKLKQKSNTIEISQLTNTFNDLADSLHKQDKLRKRLTSDVSHELRTPLATLKSHIEAMIDGIWEPSLEKLTSIQEEITRMHHLVGDLEALAKYESENIYLNKSEFDLEALIVNTVDNFKVELEAKKISLSMKLKYQIINADIDKLKQVLINLISNALKFTPKGGQINILAYREGDITKIHIIDNGIGIAKTEHTLVFERFYRIDQSRTRHTGGSGIGLAIVKSIIEAHKGTIELVSDLNMGSEFIISIPNY